MDTIITSDDQMPRLLRSSISRAVGGPIGAQAVLGKINEAEEECCEYLLNGIPAEGGRLQRATLERVIRCSFRSGALHAANYVKPSEI